MKKIKILLVLLILVGCSNNVIEPVLEEITEVVVLEYGENISMDPSDYTQREATDEEEVIFELVIKDTEEVVSLEEMIEVGSYTLSIYIGEYHTTVVDVEVTDTTAPVITGVVALETNHGEEIDLLKDIELFDLSQCDVSVNDIDFNESGEFELVYTAKDMYDNISTEKTTLTILEEVEETTTGSTSSGSSSNSGSTSGSSGSTGGTSRGDSSTGSGGSSTTTPSTPTPTTPTFTSSDTSAEAEMLASLNAERAKLGLSPLVYSSSIYEGCKIRAMELTELYSHSRPNGGSWADVAPNVWAENISYSSINYSGSYAVGRFMDSEVHRSNMMSSSYTNFACKRVVYNGIAYWVQLFG